MKVMILGVAGMAGHTIYEYLKAESNYNLITVARNRKLINSTYIIKDVEYNMNKLQKIVKKQKPDVIINCIGLLVKACDNNPRKAVFVNSYFPHILSTFKSKIIHLSTDCVFSGKRGNYKVDDEKDATGIYGKTKALGEIDNDKDLTLRMSIIGKELKDSGTGLFEWFMRQDEKISGYSNVYWSGITTLELAKAIYSIIEFNPELTGIYQLALSHKISKYTLLKLISKVWNKKITIKKNRDKICDKSLINSSTPIKNYILPLYYKLMLEEYLHFCNAFYYIYEKGVIK